MDHSSTPAVAAYRHTATLQQSQREMWMIGLILHGLFGGLVAEVRERRRRRELRAQCQQLIDDSARIASTVSTELMLKLVEDLNATYVYSGQREEALRFEKAIREFREQNGPRLPVDKANALMKELEETFWK
jgi:hypothetical protein